MSSKTISFSVPKSLSSEDRQESRDDILSEFDDYEVTNVHIDSTEVAYTVEINKEKDTVRCKAITSDGDRCKRTTEHESGYCYQHR